MAFNLAGRCRLKKLTGLKDLKKYKFLHVFGPDTKNSYGILSQLHKKFSSEEHKYLISSYASNRQRFPKLQEFDDLMFIPEEGSILGKIWFFFKTLWDSEIIIWHSLYFTTYKYTIFLYFCRFLLKKSVWIEWGADLYIWNYPHTTLKNKIKNKIAVKIRKSFNYIGCCFECDDVEVHRQFGKSKKCFYTPLPNPMKNPTELIELIEASKPPSYPEHWKNRSLMIQIAHNSFSFNHHIKLIDYLKRFKEHDIVYVIPLSYGVYGINGQYGGVAYRKKVITYAFRELDGRNLNLFQNIPFEEYIRFLWDIDIAVFDFSRPCGLGTLRILLLMEKKVFLPSGSPYYKYLISKGLPIYDTNKIPEMTFEEFTEPPVYDNKEWVYEYMNNDKVMENWAKMFDELKERFHLQ